MEQKAQASTNSLPTPSNSEPAIEPEFSITKITPEQRHKILSVLDGYESNLSAFKSDSCADILFFPKDYITVVETPKITRTPVKVITVSKKKL
jgi:hypothetical protein